MTDNTCSAPADSLVAAVRKLVKAKGRFHTEQNYAALVAALDAYDVAAITLQAAPARLPLQHFGWMYIDDDGHGPFYTESEKNANRYIHNWKAYKVAPADGHICDYSLGYGRCSQCLMLEGGGNG